jgi:hypothetical protein
LGALAQVARERRDVHEALRALHAWLGRQLDEQERGRRRDSGLQDKVLSQGEGRRVVSGHELREPRSIDLTLIVRRARWKAAAVRFAQERRSDPRANTDELRRLEEGLRAQRADMPDCFPWMLDASAALPADAALTAVVGCWEVVASAAEGIAKLKARSALEPAPPAELLYLLAEAQSALLAAVRALDLRGDSDQRDLFQWLKDQTTRHRIYVDRHMRLDDPADPNGWSDLGQRLQTKLEEIALRGQERRDRQQILNKLRFHARKVLEAGRLLDADRNSILATLELFGDPAEARRERPLLDLLEPLARTFGDDEALGPVLRAIVPAAGGSAPRRPLDEASELLAGSHVLMLAAAEDEEARQTLVAELRLGELEWIAVEDPDGTELLEREIPRTAARLVLLGTRLTPAAYAEFKRLSTEHSKLFVRLPEGLTPDIVARQVLRQVGWRLRPEGLPTRG